MRGADDVAVLYFYPAGLRWLLLSQATDLPGGTESREHSAVAVFGQRKMAALVLLGFSSGLPLYLTSRTLQAWLTVEEVNLTAIGLFSLVGLPYSLKFLWSPLLDRYVPPLLGRRRGWLVIFQLALLLAIAAMAFQSPRRALALLALNALLIAFLSASQDVVFDAYKVDVLEEREMGAGAAMGVLGYRVGLLVAGSATLMLADRLSWPTVYLLTSVLMLIGVWASLRAPEPLRPVSPPRTIGEAVRLPFVEFVRRLGGRRTLAVLLFVVLYKFGDALAGGMATAFLLQTGFSQGAVGAVQGGVGLGATIVGVLAGGAVVARLGINRSLWIFGATQAATNLAYLWLAQMGKVYGFMVAAVVVENFATGLVAAAFVAFLMSLCSMRFSATQFALLSSLNAVSRDLLLAPAGRVAEATGWTVFFAITLLAALPGLLLLPVVAPWGFSRTGQRTSPPTDSSL